jgi:hypothetical protein
MDALQRASRPSNHVKVSDEGSKTIDIPLIVRNIAGRYSCPSKPVSRITAAPHMQGITTNVSI